MVARAWYVLLMLLLFSLLVPIPYQPYTIITNSQSSTLFIPSGRYILPITIHTNLTSPVYNYSLEIVLNATNFNGWSYINTSNIYFLDQNGHPLYYWVQELNTTGREAVIWVNTTLTNTTIYMLYGGYNPYPEYNNGSRVFLFFDDFSTNTIGTKWDEIVTGGTSKLVISNGILEIDNDGSYRAIAKTKQTFGRNIVIGVRAKKVENIEIYWCWNGTSYTSTYGVPENVYDLMYRSWNSPTDFALQYRNPSGTVTNLATYTYTLDTDWHTYKIIVTSTTMTVYMDGSQILNASDTTLTQGYIALSGREQPAGVTAEYDWIYVYKYIDPSNYTVSIGTPYPVAEFVLPISISTNLSSPVYNYSLRLELNFTNVPGWSTVFINDNIFVLDSQGHPLYYWIESYNRTTESMVLWVNTTLADQTIYIYTLPHYNPYKSYNDPNKVFLWYDDFSSNTTAYYTSTGAYRGGISPSFTIDTTNGYMNVTLSANGNGFVLIPVTTTGNIVIEGYGRLCTLGGNYQIGIGVHGSNSEDIVGRIDDYTNTLDIIQGNANGWTTLASQSITIDDSFHYMSFIWSGNTFTMIYDNIKINTTYTPVDTSYTVGMFIAYNSGTENTWDWIRVRKYVDPSNYTVSIEHPIVLFAQNVIPVTIHTKLSQPVYNYSLRLEFNTTNIQNWDNIFGSGNSTTIYVLDQNGHPLYFWAETYNTTAKDVVLWVNTTLTNETILVFTESFNNLFTNYNNPNKVFLFYDNFSTNTIGTKWNTIAGTPSISNGILDIPAGSNAWAGVVSTVAFSGDFIVETEMRISSSSGVGDGEIHITDYIPTGSPWSTPDWYRFALTIKDALIYAERYLSSDSSQVIVDNSHPALQNTWYILGIAYTTSGIKYYINYSLYATTTYYSATKWYIVLGSWNTCDSQYDWVRVRKYVDPNDYTISIGTIVSTIIYGGYGSISPTSVYGVLSSINSYSYTVNFTVSVTNNGTVPQNYTLLVLNDNNVAVYNETVSVNAGDTYTSWFTYTFTSPANTTWYYIVEANNTIYTNITIPINIVKVGGAYVPIHITYYGSQPVPNYTLMLNLTSNNFNGWGYIGGNMTIGFLDSNGNPLYYWVDYLNVTEEQAIIYVNITLTNTTIYMYINLNPNPLLQYDNPYRTFLWYDGFETWSGWVQYGSGVVSQTSSPVRHGSYALLKNSYGDPNGGYKQLPFTLNFPFILEAYVDRTGTSSAPADRIGVIDDSGNGYGIARDSNAGTIYIDKRSSYTATTYGSTSLKVNPAVGEWYMMQFIWNNGNMIARMYLPPSYELIGSTSYSDTSYTSFTRVYVFGGYPYVVDDLRIRKYVDPSTFTVEIGSLVGIAGVVFTGSITPTNVTVPIPSVNATVYQLFNMTVSNIGNETGWAIMELVGDNNTVLYSNNVTLASGETYSAVYNATFTYSDHGIHTWYYIVKNDTKVFVNDTVTITVVINITLTFNYTQYFNQSILPSWVNSTWFNYTIDIPEPSALEEWIPSMWYNYTQTAEATLNGVAWIQANSIPRIIGTNACITLYTNTTGNWTQVYHVCNSYAYYLVVEIVLEPVGVPADYPNAYISILVWDNSVNDYRYIYSIYVPSGNQSVLLFANQYYKLEIPASGTTIHGYNFVLDKYVLDNNIIDPPSIYLNGSHVITIYYEIYSGTTPPPTTTTIPYPSPTATFPYVTVPIVPPSANVSIPSSPNIGYPGLDTPEAVFSLLLYIALIVLFLKLFNVYQAVAVASGIMMILSIFLFGILAVWLYFILFIIAVALYWKLGGGG